jgi:DNA polymerase III subunit delta'
VTTPGVFASLIGQDDIVEILRSAVRTDDPGMTHSWLFTGPPGSGRSVAARAFAAALQCPDGGCGHCHECHTALTGAHADVEIVSPSGLSYGVAETRELVTRAALAPTRGRWQVTIVEDADRFTEQALNALLKSIEEPPRRAVWLLCAPSQEDLLPTIRSRCRLLTLRIPRVDELAEHLAGEGVDRSVAAFAARAGQSHVGRARRLATDPDAQRRRREVLELPMQVATVGGCFTAAANLVEAARDDAAAVVDALDAAETTALKEALGDVGGRGRARPRGVAGALSDLEKRQRSRATRTQRDSLDRALLDLAAFYRDVLMVQLGTGLELVNPDLVTSVQRLAQTSAPEATLRRIEAVLACREAVDLNVAPLLAVEAMALSLHKG